MITVKAFKFSKKGRERAYNILVKDYGIPGEEAVKIIDFIEHLLSDDPPNRGGATVAVAEIVRGLMPLYFIVKKKGFYPSSMFNWWTLRYGRGILSRQRDPAYVAEVSLRILKSRVSAGDDIFSMPGALLPDEMTLMNDISELRRRAPAGVSTRTLAALVLWKKYGVKQRVVSEVLGISRVSIRKYAYLL